MRSFFWYRSLCTSWSKPSRVDIAVEGEGREGVEPGYDLYSQASTEGPQRRHGRERGTTAKETRRQVCLLFAHSTKSKIRFHRRCVLANF